MWTTFRAWLDDIVYSDPLERHQAGVLQIILVIIVVASLVGMPISLLTSTAAPNIILAFTIYPLLIICTVLSLVLLRRGRFAIAVYIICGSMIIIIGIAALAVGLQHSETVLLSFAIPIVLSGLLLGRRGLLGAILLCVAAIGGVAMMESFVPRGAGFVPMEAMQPIGLFGSFTLVLAVLGIMIDRFGSSLQHALHTTKAREHELELLRDSLEQLVEDRTAALQAILGQSEQREEQLAHALADLQMNQNLVRDLSAPILPVLQGVLVAPLIGAIDDARAITFEQHILAQVEQQHARHVIFDITGVPLVDTHVAQILLRAASAVRLLGAQALLVGVRPEVAQTLVTLGARLDDIPTYPNLREAVAVLASGKHQRQGRSAIPPRRSP